MAELKRIAIIAAASPATFGAILPLARKWVAEAEAESAAIPRRRSTTGKYVCVRFLVGAVHVCARFFVRFPSRFRVLSPVVLARLFRLRFNRFCLLTLPISTGRSGLSDPAPAPLYTGSTSRKRARSFVEGPNVPSKKPPRVRSSQVSGCVGIQDPDPDDVRAKGRKKGDGGKCSICKEPGHNKSKCPDNKENKENRENSRPLEAHSGGTCESAALAHLAQSDCLALFGTRLQCKMTQYRRNIAPYPACASAGVPSSEGSAAPSHANTTRTQTGGEPAGATAGMSAFVSLSLLIYSSEMTWCLIYCVHAP
jgi:hypothetical protein